MITLYFSGTGNTKFIAERFSSKMHAKLYSIEEHLNFSQLIKPEKQIALLFPIYISRCPRIFREFLLKHKKDFEGKELISICTQMCFSGDGARSIFDYLDKIDYKIKYAEHINMPSNISNIKFLAPKNGKAILPKLKKACKKIDKICDNLHNGKIVKRGFNPFSRALAATQAPFVPKLDKKYKNNVKTNSNCITCGLCAKICPMHNLSIENKKVVQHNNCTFCYRCVNNCPTKAITVMAGGSITTQYKGI